MFGRHAVHPSCGRRIFYDPSTEIGRSLFFKGEFEKKELAQCQKYISESSTVLDIGANIGTHSIYFSSLAKNGYVLAFEPSIKTFCLLAKNVADVPNIIPINLAATDEGKIADFSEASDNAYSSLKDTQRKEVFRIRKAPCMKIDDVVTGLALEHIDFIKIDVEGLEFNVLRGLQKVILRDQPVIFCEIYQGKNSNQRPNETVRFLLERGYQAYVMRNGMLTDYEHHDDAYYNYFFLPKAF